MLLFVMTAKIRLLSAVPVAAFVLAIILFDRVIVPREGDEEVLESLPVIDFPLLGEARPLDLINKELDFPEALIKLDGCRVSLVGFMAPYDSLEDMRRCMIVPSYVGCTFCSPPSLSQVVYVTQGNEEAAAGRTYSFIEQASLIRGTLKLSLPGSAHEGQQQGFPYSIENAKVTAYSGSAPVRATGHGTTAAGLPDHLVGRGAKPLSPVAIPDLVREVGELLGREPLRPIVVEPVSAKSLGDLVRGSLEETFPETNRVARGRAFALLGMLPEGADWIDALARIQLGWRVAATDEKGERISLLNSVPSDHPYVRLVLVGEITEALIRQHSTIDRAEPEKEYENDDTRRVQEALLQGLSTVSLYRYARSHGISTMVQPPAEFIRQRQKERTMVLGELHRWQTMPSEAGAFFVEAVVGPVSPLSEINVALDRPPATTMELFRPRWYQDHALWQPDPVPEDFADALIDVSPTLTDVLGVAGLVPWLAQWYSVDVSQTFCGGWAGDRWAFWEFSDGTSALLLETRWQNEDSATQFRNAISDTESLVHETGSRTVRLIKASSPTALDRLTSALAADS